MKLKELFKTRPCWFKGGIISVCLLLIIYLIPESVDGELIEKIMIVPFLTFLPLLWLFSMLGFLVDSIFNVGGGYMGLAYLPYEIGTIFMLIITIIYYFVIGSIVGIIINRIITRKNKSKQISRLN